MLFRKKKEEPPRVCTECGCLIDRLRAKKVTQEILRSSYNTAFSEPSPLFYCGRCDPPYDLISISLSGGNHRYFISTPRSYEEVTEEGKPLKKKK